LSSDDDYGFSATITLNIAPEGVLNA
jgi:hypothetical protein